MLDAFDALDLPMAALVNSTMYDYAPALMAACRARGDEIVGHGRTNAERQGDLFRSHFGAQVVSPALHHHGEFLFQRFILKSAADGL
jgi:hypothetical protein